MSTGPIRIVVMGPSGSGKSTIGAAVAARLGLPFTDGDDLHPAANIAKMSGGVPLGDADRAPWLDAVAEVLATSPDGMVVACSALARRYRERILTGCRDAFFIELGVTGVELERRTQRRNHFMPSALLQSQLDAWERLSGDEQGASIDAEGSLHAVIQRVIAAAETVTA